jgi:hypothetical protein
MGRPLKQKFFDPVEGSVTFGGESISTINLITKGQGYYLANAAVSFGAPNLPGGVQATASVTTVNAGGYITAVSITNAGSGYTSAPAVTITGANSSPASFTTTLTSAVTNVIATSAYIPAANGGSSAVAGDIIKQVGARRYKVTTAQGTGKCKLVTAAPGAGEMTITATDSQSSTYYVKKLDENTATLVRNSGSGFDYANGEQAKWTLTGSAEAPGSEGFGDIGTVVVSSN